MKVSTRTHITAWRQRDGVRISGPADSLSSWLGTETLLVAPDGDELRLVPVGEVVLLRLQADGASGKRHKEIGRTSKKGTEQWPEISGDIFVPVRGQNGELSTRVPLLKNGMFLISEWGDCKIKSPKKVKLPAFDTNARQVHGIVVTYNQTPAERRS